MSPAPGIPNADDLMVLLAVARYGRFTRAAESLGLNHTTVSRRITALERRLGGRVFTRSSGSWELTELGHQAYRAAERVEEAVQGIGNGSAGLRGMVRFSCTEGLSAHLVAPAVAAVHRRHRLLSIEVITETRRALQHRSGLDFEIGVGKPEIRNAESLYLGHYHLGLYATVDYLERNDPPASIADLAEHPLIFYIDSLLHVDDLDGARRLLPTGPPAITSTSVFTHIETTRAGAGIGLLPDFLAERDPGLVRVLADEMNPQLEYWLIGRQESLRRDPVRVTVAAIQAQMAHLSSEQTKPRPVSGRDDASAAR